MHDTPQSRAERLLAETAHFQALGLGELASLARVVARDCLDLAHRLEHALGAAEEIRKRHEQYVAYHQAHCFDLDGKAKSGAPVEPLRIG